jgi:hypothetical protein
MVLFLEFLKRSSQKYYISHAASHCICMLHLFFSCVVVILWADPCTYGRSFKKAIGKVYLE